MYLSNFCTQRLVQQERQCYTKTAFYTSFQLLHDGNFYTQNLLTPVAFLHQKTCTTREAHLHQRVSQLEVFLHQTPATILTPIGGVCWERRETFSPAYKFPNCKYSKASWIYLLKKKQCNIFWTTRSVFVFWSQQQKRTVFCKNAPHKPRKYREIQAFQLVAKKKSQYYSISSKKKVAKHVVLKRSLSFAHFRAVRTFPEFDKIPLFPEGWMSPKATGLRQNTSLAGLIGIEWCWDRRSYWFWNFLEKDHASVTPPETNIAPENGWLEYDRFLLGRPIFRCYVSFREGKPLFSSPPFVCGGSLDQVTVTVTVTNAGDLGGGGSGDACQMGTTFGGLAGRLIILNLAFPIVPKQKTYSYIYYIYIYIFKYIYIYHIE